MIKKTINLKRCFISILFFFTSCAPFTMDLSWENELANCSLNLYDSCGFFYPVDSITVDYGTASDSGKPSFVDVKEVSYYLISEKIPGVEVDQDTGLIFWNDEVEIGSYEIRVKVMDHQTKSYSTAVFNLYVRSPDPKHLP